MFAGANASLITHLAGIAPTAPGYAKIRIAPALPAQLSHLAASLETVRGRVAVAWERGREVTRTGAMARPNPATAAAATTAGATTTAKARPSPAARVLPSIQGLIRRRRRGHWTPLQANGRRPTATTQARPPGTPLLRACA
jgi:alpha-L-rhamnosidase